MNIRLSHLVCALAGGVLLGVTGVSVLRAQTSPPAYYVADFQLTDPEGIKPYRDQFDATIKPYGGRWLARAGTVNKVEGDSPRGRYILIGFDNMEKAMAWYNSPTYAAIRPYRQKSGQTEAFIIEGLPN